MEILAARERTKRTASGVAGIGIGVALGVAVAMADSPESEDALPFLLLGGFCMVMGVRDLAVPSEPERELTRLGRPN